MVRAWVAWGTLSAVGIGTILLPDRGPRLFSLSDGHGPSLIDSIGIVLLVAGWAALDAATWRRRRMLSVRPIVGWLLAVAAVTAAGLVLWSVLRDHGAWWLVGSFVLAAIQLMGAAGVTLAQRISAHEQVLRP